MNVEEIRAYCLSLDKTEECFPFDEETLVFKVCGKMYALVSLEKKPLQMSLKCNPIKALALRENHDFVTPAYHMNKKHWNSITIDGRQNKKFICDLIDHSYQLVVSSLPKKIQSAIDKK